MRCYNPSAHGNSSRCKCRNLVLFQIVDAWIWVSVSWVLITHIARAIFDGGLYCRTITHFDPQSHTNTAHQNSTEVDWKDSIFRIDWYTNTLHCLKRGIQLCSSTIQCSSFDVMFSKMPFKWHSSSLSEQLVCDVVDHGTGSRHASSVAGSSIARVTDRLSYKTINGSYTKYATIKETQCVTKLKFIRPSSQIRPHSGFWHNQGKWKELYGMEDFCIRKHWLRHPNFKASWDPILFDPALRPHGSRYTSSSIDSPRTTLKYRIHQDSLCTCRHLPRVLRREPIQCLCLHQRWHPLCRAHAFRDLLLWLVMG